MVNVRKIFIVGIGFWVFTLTAFSQSSCPTPPTSIDPSISSVASYNVNTQMYNYRYTVRNAKDSLLPIDYLTVLINDQPSNVQSPANWSGSYITLADIPFNLSWSTIDVSSSAIVQANSSDLPVPTFAIQPGAQLEGFILSSSNGPGILQYYTEGFTQIPSATPTPSDDEPNPNCPGWDFISPYFQTLVTGIATGPSSPNVISVRLRLRDEAGEHQYGSINPKTPTGNIGVLVRSSRTFDASTINVPSIRFGPANAIPLSSRLVPSNSGKDASADEREEWEIIQDKLNSDQGGNVKPENLLLIFDLKSLGVQCVLDKALFLTGTTQSGEGIIGGVSTRTVGCDIHHPGQRR